MPRNTCSKPGTHDDFAHLVLHSIPCAGRCSRLRLGGIAAARPGTLLLTAQLSSAPANHRPSTAPEHKIVPGTSSRHDVVARIYSVIDEHKRNRYCVSDALTHVSIITAQCQNRPAYSAFLKAGLSHAPQGGWWGLRPRQGEKTKILPLVNPLTY